MASDDSTPTWLAQLFERHGRALVLYARQWCTSPEDVVQEALLELARQHPRPAHVIGWLYRAVRNGAISAARQDVRRVRREAAVASRETWFEPASDALDAQEAAAALAALPVELREVVVARLWGDLKYSEIAELAGVSISTAQRRYEQALQQLQTRLDKPCTTRRGTTND